MSRSNYDNEGFESDSIGRASASDEKKHLLRLSIDFLSVKDLQRTGGSLTVMYNLRLAGQQHSFKS
jgi:centrosomal protein CEP120